MPNYLAFEHPWFLLFLVLFVITSLIFKHEKSAYYMPHFYKKIKESKENSKILIFFKWLIVVSVVTALSDPIVKKSIQTNKKNSIDIVLSLDTSGSMSLNGFSEKDYNKTRLDVVQEVVTAFIHSRIDDRIGIVLFGTKTVIASPLSFDKDAQINIINQLKVGILGKNTALLDSLLSSIELLKNSQSKSKLIILLSDGEDSASQVPLEFILKLAQKQKIKIYTIQIDKSENNMMELIANNSKAKSFSALKKSDLEKVYRTIDNLEKFKIAYKRIEIKEHIFFYPLSVAILASFLFLFFSKNREFI